MKLTLTLASIAVSTNALATTYNECFEEQGAIHKDSCHSLWYSLCDNFTLLPGETCNIETFGDA